MSADLIDDDNLELGQLGVRGEHAQQHALCQKCDLCAAAGCGVEAHTICDVIPVLLQCLKRHPACECLPSLSIAGQEEGGGLED